MDKREKRLGRFLLQARLDRGAAEGQEISKADQADWLSQNSLDLRVPPNTYGSWENGERLPRPDYWPVLVEKLGTQVNVILGIQASSLIDMIEDPDLKETVRNWEHMTPALRSIMPHFHKLPLAAQEMYARQVEKEAAKEKKATQDEQQQFAAL